MPCHFLPSVHLEFDAGSDLLAFMGTHTGVMGTSTAGTAAVAQGDVMASFSSRGGPGLTLGVSKPDITAPGVQILAGHTPLPATVEGGLPGQLFQAIQGTSMSSPHVAGAAALIRHLRPSWTPGQIKSALRTTATDAVVKEDGVTPADPFDMGSGRLDLSQAGDPGLTFDESALNYVALQNQLWDANYPSLYVPALLGEITVRRTVHSHRQGARAWRLVVTAPPDLRIAVPPQVNPPSFGEEMFEITVDGRDIPVGQARHAVIEFRRPHEATLRFPITVVRGTSQVPLTKTCSPLTIPQNTETDCTITLANTTFEPAGVRLADELPYPLRLVHGSVVNATESGNGLSFEGMLAPALPPDVTIGPGTSVAGYLPLSIFGVAPLGGVGDETIVNFNTQSFDYAGESYSRVGFTSNGYLVVGGGTAADLTYVNQGFPDPAPPNNVLAPFWTDLNPGAAGFLRLAVLTDGVDSWLIFEWEDVPEYSNPGNTHSFQVWIGLNTDANPGEDIAFTYGPNTGAGDGGFLTTGAENRFGTRGANYYFDGSGTLPVEGTELRVTSTPAAPGETRVITFSATGRARRDWRNCAEMTSTSYPGVQAACVYGTVVK